MIAKINRIARSIISLNRKIEYETIVSMLNLDDRDNLLDVGSGDGFWTYKFSFLVNDVTGIDPSDHLLSLAKKAHNLLGCKGITRSDFRFFKNTMNFVANNCYSMR